LATDPINNNSHGGQPLGELLVERGLITPEQLDQALDAQREHQRPLGEMIVRLGFASGRTIAQALATQHGRMVKSEYGFAMGFDAKLPETEENTEAPPVTAPSNGLRLVPSNDGAIAPAPAAVAQTIRSPQVPTEPLVHDDRVRRLTNQLFTAIGNLARSEAARASAMAAAAEGASALHVLEQEAAEQARQIEELQNSLAAAAHAAPPAAEIEEMREHAARLEQELERARRESVEAAETHQRQLAETKQGFETRIAQMTVQQDSSPTADENAARLEKELEQARRESVEAVEAHRRQLTDMKQHFQMQVAQLTAQLEQQRSIDATVEVANSTACELTAVPERTARLEPELERTGCASTSAEETHHKEIADIRRELHDQVAQLEARREQTAREQRVPSRPTRPEPHQSIAPNQQTPVLITRGTAIVSDLGYEQRCEIDSGEPADAPSFSAEGLPGGHAPEPPNLRPGPRHRVFFIASAHGYMLVERAGTTPKQGDVIDVSEYGGPTAGVVTKVAPSPLPASDLDCAYLI
jgi:hypothetical protein